MNFERLLPIRLDETDSTNAEAMRLLKHSKPAEGSCIVANFQREGRGQRSNVWVSRPGENLLVSFILYPRTGDRQTPFLLSKTIALAVQRTLSHFSPDHVEIKWPNDILIQGKKAAGILIENQWSGSNWHAAIAGIGINVNQTEFTLERATSVACHSHEAISNEQVLLELQKCLSQEYERFCKGEEAAIEKDYHGLLFGITEYHTYQTPTGPIAAKVVRVTADGKLELICDKGNTNQYDLSEARLLY